MVVEMVEQMVVLKDGKLVEKKAALKGP